MLLSSYLWFVCGVVSAMMLLRASTVSIARTDTGCGCTMTLIAVLVLTVCTSTIELLVYPKYPQQLQLAVAIAVTLAVIAILLSSRRVILKRISYTLIVITCLLVLSSHTSIYPYTLYSLSNTVNPDTTVVFVAADELESNLFLFDEVTALEDGRYKARVVQMPKGDESTFYELLDTFRRATYVPYLTQNPLMTNCQGMTLYIAQFCNEHNLPYRVVYGKQHMYIRVKFEDLIYQLDFNMNSSITTSEGDL